MSATRRSSVSSSSASSSEGSSSSSTTVDAVFVPPRVALVDTSGYASDCNFSALMPQHAMKPYRVLATMELVRALGIDGHCRTVVPPLVTVEDLMVYHAESYVANMGLHSSRSWLWNPMTSRVPFTGDCPPVEGLMEHSLATASGTLMGAVLLNSGQADVAVHWGGGMHHTKCGECSGFCYVNDIVLGILELLKCHERVLYVDIDMHHGDGVDEAFCQSDRVFTLSLHKFGEGFFPGTGHPRDVGVGRGAYYTMNLAVWDGITDFFYLSIFRHALRRIVEGFAPDVIVLQCGADSLAGDRLGLLNLTSWGHGECVREVKNLGIPLLVVGGGGYTIHNVAKLWAYETSILCDCPLPLSCQIPVAALPCTGWLHEEQPLLLVPQMETTRTMAGLDTQRAHRAAIDQVNRHMAALAELERARAQAPVKTEAEAEEG